MEVMSAARSWRLRGGPCGGRDWAADAHAVDQRPLGAELSGKEVSHPLGERSGGDAPSR
jgi:hypothetical protein